MKYEAAQKIFNNKYNVPREFHEANYERFQAGYSGSYSNGSCEITVQPIEAFHILYMRRNNKIYGEQLGIKGTSNKGNRKEGSKGSDKRGKLRDSGKPAIRSDKRGEVEGKPESGDGAELFGSETQSGSGDPV